jgi:hypothetical protein
MFVCGKRKTYPMIQWGLSAPKEHAPNDFSNELFDGFEENYFSGIFWVSFKIYFFGN